MVRYAQALSARESSLPRNCPLRNWPIVAHVVKMIGKGSCAHLLMVCHCNGARWFKDVGGLYFYLYLKGQLRPCARWAQQWCDIVNLQKSCPARQYVKKVKVNYDFKRLIQHDNLQRNTAQQFANKAIQYDNLQRSGPVGQFGKREWTGTKIANKSDSVQQFAKKWRLPMPPSPVERQQKSKWWLWLTILS